MKNNKDPDLQGKFVWCTNPWRIAGKSTHLQIQKEEHENDNMT